MVQQTIETYIIENKLYVTTDFVCAYFNVSKRTITNWTKDWLEKTSERGIKQSLFLFKNVYDGYNENVNKAKSRAGSKKRGVEVDVDAMMDESNLEDIDSLSYDEAERRKKIAELKLANIKIAKEEGELIDADDVDKAMYEQAMMHMTKLSNDEKTVPILLGLTDKQTEELKEHNKDHIDLLASQIEQKFKKDPSNYDVFVEVMEARRRGDKPKVIIEKLKQV